jgi:hypothetical protein
MSERSLYLIVMSDTPERFAFGTESVDGYPCVAVAGGFDVSGNVLQVAEQYDQTCRERTGEMDGTVDSETAEEVWNECVEWFHNKADRLDDDGYMNRAVQIGSIAAEGEEVAEVVF